MIICKSHCTENQIYVFSEMKLRGLNHNSYIYVPVSDLYIPRFVLPIWPQQNRQTDSKNICINCSQIHECGNWEAKHYNSALEIIRPHF
jgi:hypothetical protein